MEAVVSAQVEGHDLLIEVVPERRLALLMDTIASAQSSIQITYYIFADDQTGRTMLVVLQAACARGVAVSLIVDGFGSQDYPDRFFAPLIAAGAKFARFNPHYGRRYLLRNHQKMLIVDERIALIGGCNISDDYFITPMGQPFWYDMIVLIEGPAVERLAAFHAALWAWTIRPDAKVWQLRAILSDFSEAAGSLRWLYGGFFPRLSPLTRAIRSDLEHARHVQMVQAFFAPNWGMLRKLGRICQRGGSCQITTAAYSKSTTTVAASRHCYHRLMSFGVTVQEYIARPLHMKLIVVDDVVYIGSANFDARSLFINVELMLRIDDAVFATQVRKWRATESQSIELITPSIQSARATFLNRLRWLLAYFIVVTLDYGVSRQLNISDHL